MSASILPNGSIEGSAQPIELGWSSQRLDLRDEREDWTGLTNPTERRKLQNRLNQRRRRERARTQNSREATADSACSASRKNVEFNVNESPGSNSGSNPSHEAESSTELSPKQKRFKRCVVGMPEVQTLMSRFADHAYTSYMQGKPAVSHLPLLAKYNLNTALAKNSTLLGVTDEFYRWEGVSPMNKQGPLLGLAFHDQFADWPANLQPTQLQLCTEHHPWVDCFPWPQLRDNLLRAFEHPEICDEDELCRDICDYGGIEDHPMLLIWGPPWDPRSWEVSDQFLKKWAWLLSGCKEVIGATNYWRAKRGEALINPQRFEQLIRLSFSKQLRASGI